MKASPSGKSQRNIHLLARQMRKKGKREMSRIDVLDILESQLEVLPPQAEDDVRDAVSVYESDLDWQDDPVPLKLEKIRAAFLNGKTAAEVENAAAMMLVGDWLELIAKISPKNVQVQGEVSFKHMLEELGPIDKSQYRFKMIEAEIID